MAISEGWNVHPCANRLAASTARYHQDGLEFGSLTDLLICNPSLPVNITNGTELRDSRKSSAQRLANSWNRLVGQFRESESRFSSRDVYVLSATLRHIQGELGLVGLKSAEKKTVSNSWQDL
jgi:hypothetical protein